MAVDPAKAVIAPYRGFTVQCSLWSEMRYSSVFFVSFSGSWKALFHTPIVWDKAFILGWVCVWSRDQRLKQLSLFHISGLI
jgi:hypothetical protein